MWNESESESSVNCTILTYLKCRAIVIQLYDEIEK